MPFEFYRMGKNPTSGLYSIHEPKLELATEPLMFHDYKPTSYTEQGGEKSPETKASKAGNSRGASKAGNINTKGAGKGQNKGSNKLDKTSEKSAKDSSLYQPQTYQPTEFKPSYMAYTLPDADPVTGKTYSKKNEPPKKKQDKKPPPPKTQEKKSSPKPETVQKKHETPQPKKQEVKEENEDIFLFPLEIGSSVPSIKRTLLFYDSQNATNNW